MSESRASITPQGSALNPLTRERPTVAELQEIERWATEPMKAEGIAPRNLHMRNLVQRLLFGYAELLEFEAVHDRTMEP